MCRGWAIRHDQSNKCMQDANTTSFHGLRLRKFLHAFRDLARATNQSRNLGCHLLAGVVTLGLHVAWYFQTHIQAMPPWLLPWQKLFSKALSIAVFGGNAEAVSTFPPKFSFQSKRQLSQSDRCWLQEWCGWELQYKFTGILCLYSQPPHSWNQEWLTSGSNIGLHCLNMRSCSVLVETMRRVFALRLDQLQTDEDRAMQFLRRCKTGPISWELQNPKKNLDSLCAC